MKSVRFLFRILLLIFVRIMYFTIYIEIIISKHVIIIIVDKNNKYVQYIHIYTYIAVFNKRQEQ